MNALPHRIVIYAKDIMNITGCSSRTARRKLAEIRKKFNKPKQAYISIEEFCAFTGLREERVAAFLT
jgi:hypothetical protein